MKELKLKELGFVMIISLVSIIITNILFVKLDPIKIIIIILFMMIQVILILKYKFNYVITVFLLSCLIPGISNYGIGVISGVKISITDFLIILCFLYSFIDKKNIIYSKNDNISILLNIILIVFFIYGILSLTIDISASIRIVRNISYIVMTYWIINYFYINYFDNKEVYIYNKIYIIVTIILISILFKYYGIVQSLDQYRIYRTNESLIASLTVFFIYYLIMFNNKLKKGIMIVCFILLLFVAGFIQQERTLIIAIGLGILVSFLYLLLKKNSIKKIIKLLLVGVFIISILVIFLTFLYEFEFFKGLIDNFIINRINIIYSQNGFKLDSSLTTRIGQYSTIFSKFSNSPLNLFVGFGLAAQYLPGTFIIDSFWLWIFFDSGLVGIFLISTLFIILLIRILKISDIRWRVCILGYFIATFIMTLATPNFIWRIDDAVNFGIMMSTIKILNYKNII
ncbi:hypothetical protein [Clostridium baratii]|uniref:hypothetical protein n=1 Tax=Clostridium baratii TaxID=1561 RepID=UPI001CB1ED69|nr:hypothetical protein [Clostridium baratii]STA98787.1 Lipid A core - O-antigen ligase and related enzymes [Clostridium baratii]